MAITVIREPKSRASWRQRVSKGSPFDVEWEHAAEQVGFLVHARAQGGDVKFADVLVRVKIETGEQQRDDGEVGKKNLGDEASVPEPFHRTCSQPRVESESIWDDYRPFRSLCASGGYARRRCAA